MKHRDIFVSYSEEDGATVRALAAELRALGHSTWTYEEDGLAGISHLTQVHQAIEACRAFVLVASHNSVRAHQVIKEVEQAHERRKRIITVRLELTHQQFIASDPILEMASGTAVTLAAGKDLSVVAKRLSAAIPFSTEPQIVADSPPGVAVLPPVSNVGTASPSTGGAHSPAEPATPASAPPAPHVPTAAPAAARGRSVAVRGTALTIEYEPNLQRKQFLHILDEFSDAMQTESVERMFGRDALRRWRRHEDTIRERLDAEFSLTVIGPFKRGKSTLINALLGQELVTSDIAPETVTINEIRYGEAPSVAACLADGGRVALRPDQIKRQELEPVLAGIRGVVSHLDIRAPVEWLRGMCLVDTPGTGDLLERFDGQVQEYLTRADAVLFVLSPLAPLSETERAFLRLAVLSQDFGKMTFVLNMLDKVRTERDVTRVTDYLRAGVDQMFPGAVLFGVSALDELSRLKDEPRPLPERSLSLAARFDALRAHLKESIFDNRDLIQIDRASAEFKRLLQNVVQHTDQVRWAVDTDRSRLDEAIHACENTSSSLHSRFKDDAAGLRSTVAALGREAQEWLGLFLDRLEKVAQDLDRFSGEDLQRHFPFFLADALRTAIHRCLEAHRPQIIAAVRQFGPRVAQPEPDGLRGDAAPGLPDVLDAAFEGSRLKRSAAQATTGDAMWDRLELSKALFDLAQAQVFSVAAGLMRHLDESGRERQKSLIYQQQFSNALPELRRSVLEQAGEVYDSIARRLAEELEQQQQRDVETSLEAFRQGRHLLTAGDAKQDLAVLDRVSALVQETQDALSALQRTWSETMEGASDGGSNLALESPASS